MFTSFHLNNSSITLFAWKNKWYFNLAQFCDAMSVTMWRETIENSLEDYEKSVRKTPRQKTWLLCRDIVSIKSDMQKSNKVRLEGDIVVNENVETFIGLVQNQETFYAVEFVFFCEYLQTMYQKWGAKQESMSPENFKSHLQKQCPFWLYILDHMQELEPLVDHYNKHSAPIKTDSASETDDLLNYLEIYRVNNTSKLEKRDAEEQNLCKITREVDEQRQENRLVIFEKRQTIAQNETQTQKPKKKRTVTDRDRKAIAADQKWQCFYCLSLLDECFEVDHIERFCESGNDHHSNLWALCSNCHASKDEWDRKRRKPNIWSGYQKLTDAEKEKKRQEILERIGAI